MSWGEGGVEGRKEKEGKKRKERKGRKEKDNAEVAELRGEAEIRMKRRSSQGQGQGIKLAGKPVSASRSEMTEIVLPAMTNPLGKLLGRPGIHLGYIASGLAAHPPSHR